MRARLTYHFRRLLIALIVRPRSQRTVFLGSDWGGWHVLPNQLDATSIVYSAGVGHDSTFDQELIARTGCTIHGFDPTPIGKAEGERLAALEPRYHFHPVGLWDADGEMDFFVPAVENHDSYSIANLSGTDQSISCEVRRVPSLMAELDHSYIDLLKMDIEGAEHAVIADLLKSRIPVRQLCVEFDQPIAIRVILRSIRALRGHGFVLIKRKDWDYTFSRT
jgi:FkbM family methyltransferase